MSSANKRSYLNNKAHKRRVKVRMIANRIRVKRVKRNRK